MAHLALAWPHRNRAVAFHRLEGVEPLAERPADVLDRHVFTHADERLSTGWQDRGQDRWRERTGSRRLFVLCAGDVTHGPDAFDGLARHKQTVPIVVARAPA